MGSILKSEETDRNRVMWGGWSGLVFIIPCLFKVCICFYFYNIIHRDLVIIYKGSLEYELKDEDDQLVMSNIT